MRHNPVDNQPIKKAAIARQEEALYTQRRYEWARIQFWLEHIHCKDFYGRFGF